MGVSIKKNITIPKEDLEIIERYSKSIGKSFSEFVRIATKTYIETQEKLDLKEFLLEHCDYASEDEEKNILETIEEYDSLDRGRKISVNELL